MKLCIVSLQAVLLAVLVIQYHYVNEVEAKNHAHSVGNWLSSVENNVVLQVCEGKKALKDSTIFSRLKDFLGFLKLQDMMHDEYRKIRTTGNTIRITRRTELLSTTSTDNIAKAEDTQIKRLVNKQVLADINAETPPDASDVTDENGMTNDVHRPVKKEAHKAHIANNPRRIEHRSTNTHKIKGLKDKVEDIHRNTVVNSQELAAIRGVMADVSDVTEEKSDTEKNQVPPKLVEHMRKKKKSRKHKKKSKIHSSPMNLSYEKDRAEFNGRSRSEHKGKPNKRNFHKMSLKESNSSGSDEHLKMAKPVDIIVHIKMSD